MSSEPPATPKANDSQQLPDELPLATFSSATPSSINKRKYEEAISLLDDAAGTRVVSSSDRPPPPKRARTSLYSTLAKYGIGTSVDHSKTASLSNLQKVLMRAKGAASGKSVPMVMEKDGDNKISTYDPASREDFLARLQTFKLVTYSSKPPEIDAVAAARCGWFNEGGKEVLMCKTCKAVWTMPARHTANKDELASMINKQKAMLVDQHEASCPWRVRQSEASIYSMPIPSPSVLSGKLAQTARQLEPLLGQISIKHPLTTHQVSILHSAVNHAQSEASRKAAGKTSIVEELPQISETPIIVAFFGWDLFSPPSTSRASSSTFTTPNSRVSSPTPDGSTSKRALVTCQLCQRQVGLWTFSSASNGTAPSTPSTPTLSRTPASRQFDVLKEHRPHCPYVVKSTYLPTVSLPSKDTTFSSTTTAASQNLLRPLPFVEGWRALMSVVARSQWRRTVASSNLGSSVVSTPASELGSPFEELQDKQEVDEVGEIVKDVKSRHGGGRDLLRFVKGLLG